MNSEYEEKEIDLKDLIYTVLKAWRLLLISAVALGVLFGAFKALKKDKTDEKEAKIEYEKALKEYERALIQENSITDQLEKSTKFLESELKRLETIDDYDVVVKAECFDNIASARNGIRTAQDAQKALATDKISMPLEADFYGGVSKKTLLKFFIIGFFAGGFFSALFVAVPYIIGGEIRTASEITDYFKLRILGVFYKKEKKRSFDFIDKWLDKLFGYEKKLTESESMEILKANILNFTSENEMIMLTGSVKKGTEKVFRTLEDELSSRKFSAFNGFLYNPEALEMIGKADKVILIEKMTGTKTEELANEISYVKEMKKEITGIVLI